MTAHRYRARRGAIYIYTLSISALVATIGVAALGLRRAELARAETTADSAQARVLALSGVDLALRELARTSGWRTLETSADWSAWVAAPPGQVRYKLADEIDGDLTNDATQPCRLFVHAEAGGASRYLSVQIVAAEPTNLVTNPDLESGESPWYSLAGTPIDIRSDSPPEGLAYAEADRSILGGDITIDLDPAAISTGCTYTMEAWLRAESSSFNCSVMLINWTGLIAAPQTNVIRIGSAWQRVSTTFNGITPAGRVSLSFSGSVLDGTDIHVDDIRLYDAGAVDPVIVPGTWRVEIASSVP